MRGKSPYQGILQEEMTFDIYDHFFLKPSPLGRVSFSPKGSIEEKLDPRNISAPWVTQTVKPTKLPSKRSPNALSERKPVLCSGEVVIKSQAFCPKKGKRSTIPL